MEYEDRLSLSLREYDTTTTITVTTITIITTRLMKYKKQNKDLRQIVRQLTQQVIIITNTIIITISIIITIIIIIIITTTIIIIIIIIIIIKQVKEFVDDAKYKQSLERTKDNDDANASNKLKVIDLIDNDKGQHHQHQHQQKKDDSNTTNKKLVRTVTTIKATTSSSSKDKHEKENNDDNNRKIEQNKYHTNKTNSNTNTTKSDFKQEQNNTSYRSKNIDNNNSKNDKRTTIKRSESIFKKAEHKEQDNYQGGRRSKREREALPGHTCEHCDKWFRSRVETGVITEDQYAEHLKDCSRHKSKFTPPSTPPGFWSLTIPTPPEWKNNNNK